MSIHKGLDINSHDQFLHFMTSVQHTYKLLLCLYLAIYIATLARILRISTVTGLIKHQGYFWRIIGNVFEKFWKEYSYS